MTGPKVWPDHPHEVVSAYAHREPEEVTSMSRPDPAWRHVDAQGHEHRWHDGDAPATEYRPDRSYTLPTLREVVEPEEVDEDGFVWHPRHLECRECGETVTPGRTADTSRQFVAGSVCYFVNDAPASHGEYLRAIAALRAVGRR